MNRRTYLGTLAAAGAASIAGCGDVGVLGNGSGGSSPTYLSEPDLSGDPEDYPFPVHGQGLPEVTLRAPIAETDVTTTAFDRDVLVTFFYSNCMTACPILISTLRQIQAQAGKDGHTEDVVFLPITFDPERDTADTLTDYAERMNVDLEAGNWHFLRPDGRDAASSVVADTFGVRYERTHPEDMDQYMFDHRSLILLANRDGYVERAYREDIEDWNGIYDDLATLRRREG